MIQIIGDRTGTWILVVVGATCGFLLALLMNAGGTIYVALAGGSPAFPAALDQRFLPRAAACSSAPG